jgi:CBS domain-containing protein
MALRDLALTDASVPETASLAEAVAELFQARVPAVAVLDEGGRVLGTFSERDVLGAVFPGYIAEIKHSAFLPDDPTALDELAATARNRPVRDFVRRSEVLHADDSQIHAAERLLHSGDDALPVVEGERFMGMLSVAGLCHARLDRARTDAAARQS